MTEPSPEGPPALEAEQTGMGRERMEILILLAAAQFLVVLDASITNVALPSIGSALEFAQSELSWAVNSYVLTFGGFLLLGGRPAALAIVTSIFAEGKERNKALGVWGAVAGAGGAVGVLLGGILTLVVIRSKDSKAAISAEGQTEVIG